MQTEQPVPLVPPVHKVLLVRMVLMEQTVKMALTVQPVQLVLPVRKVLLVQMVLME